MMFLIDSDVSDLSTADKATNNEAMGKMPTRKDALMNRPSRRIQWLLVIAIFGVAILGQLPAFAQAVDGQGAGSPPTLIRSFALFGGSYQEIEASSEACSGQCLFRNVFTNDCTCPGGYTPIESARILTDTGEGDNVTTCGSTLWICLK